MYSPENSRDRESWRRLIRYLLPWGVWLVGVALFWQVNLFLEIPGYGDSQEILWHVERFTEYGFNFDEIYGLNPNFYAPNGWIMANNAQVSLALLLAGVLGWIGGAVFGMNAAMLIGHGFIFAGSVRAFSVFIGRPWALLGATIHSFWFLIWFRTAGHIHMIYTLAALMWFLWALEKSHNQPERRLRWLVVAGCIWSLGTYTGLYSIFLLGVTFGVWLLVRFFSPGMGLTARVGKAVVPAATFVLLSLPMVGLVFWARSRGVIHDYGMSEIPSLSAAVWDLVSPQLYHPWQTWPVIAPIHQWFHRGAGGEVAATNFGLLLIGLAMYGGIRSPRTSSQLLLGALAVVGGVLALGPILKVTGPPLQVAFAPGHAINTVLWSAGHAMKPTIFSTPTPGYPYLQGIPLPAYIPLASLPMFEGARVVARYAHVAALGMFPLALMGLAQVPTRWLQLALAGVFVVAFMPVTQQGVVFDRTPHAAVRWVGENTPTDSVVLDVGFNPDPAQLWPMVEARLLYMGEQHGRRMVTGAGSAVPEAIYQLQLWMSLTPDAWQAPDFDDRLAEFETGFLLVHFMGISLHDAEGVAGVLDASPALELEGCFAPPESGTSWEYPICVLSVNR